jgi:hypothetical protein
MEVDEQRELISAPLLLCVSLSVHCWESGIRMEIPRWIDTST